MALPSDTLAVPVEAPAPVDTPRRHVAVVDGLLIVAGLGILGVGQAHSIWGDADHRYDALTALLADQRLLDNPYSLVGPLFATPLWLIGRLVGEARGWTSMFNVLLFQGAILALYVLLRGRMAPALLRRFLLLLVGGSLIAAHTQTFYGEVFTMVAVGVGIVVATVPGPGRLRRGAGWLGVVLGAANTPASFVGLGLVGADRTLRRRRLRYALPVLAGLALIMVEAWARRGSPFASGYGHEVIAVTPMPYSGVPGWSYPVVFGLLAIIFSFGRGLIFFMPGLVLPVARRLRAQSPELAEVYRLWMLFLAGLVLVYAPWWAWHGGIFFGPRFFLIAILPASLALAVWLSDADAGPLANLVTLGVLALSVWVAADALFFAQVYPDTCYGDNFALESFCHFTPEFSALWYPFLLKPRLTGVQLVESGYYLLVFGWLAAPVVARLGRQTRDRLAGAARPLLRPDAWRL